MDRKQKGRSMFEKGKKGQKKRYFTGKCKRRKNLPLNIMQGETVVFESRCTIYQGVFIGPSQNPRQRHAYIIGSANGGDNIIATREEVVTSKSHATNLKYLRIEDRAHLELGKTLLVPWEKDADGFVEMVSAQMVSVDGETCWMKPDNRYEYHMYE